MTDAPGTLVLYAPARPPAWHIDTHRECAALDMVIVIGIVIVMAILVVMIIAIITIGAIVFMRLTE